MLLQLTLASLLKSLKQVPVAYSTSKHYFLFASHLLYLTGLLLLTHISVLIGFIKPGLSVIYKVLAYRFQTNYTHIAHSQLRISHVVRQLNSTLSAALWVW